MTQTPEGDARPQLGLRNDLSKLVVHGPALEGGQTRADEFVDSRQGIEVFEEGRVNPNLPGRLTFSPRKGEI